MSTAAELAGLLLRHFNIDGKPDLATICRDLGVRVKEEDLTGADGTLVRSKHAQKGIIGVRRSIREAGRKRFVIAHEIGHFTIPYHRELGTACNADLIDRYATSMPTPEREANEFAAELLLPASAVRKRFTLTEPSLDNISVVATDFETSLTATTWRFLDLSDAPAAMVWSQYGNAIWYRASDSLPFKLPISDLPAAGSIAGRIFSGDDVAGTGPLQIDPYLWFNPQDAEQITFLCEDSRALPNYGAIFTLLWVVRMHPTASAGDDDELMSDLDPEEFTLNRKNWPR